MSLNKSSDNIMLNKPRGIKIVDKTNKRVSDIFHTKNVQTFQGLPMTHSEKMKNVQDAEKLVEKKIKVLKLFLINKEISPYIGGKRNNQFTPIHNKFIPVVGDREKFDSVFSYQNELSKKQVNEGEGYLFRIGKNYNFQNLKYSYKIENYSSKNIENINKQNHEFFSNNCNENNYTLDSKQNFGRKKLDFENMARNKKTYLEEFNVNN